jgi:hypothetical protein
MDACVDFFFCLVESQIKIQELEGITQELATQKINLIIADWIFDRDLGIF